MAYALDCMLTHLTSSVLGIYYHEYFAEINCYANVQNKHFIASHTGEAGGMEAF